MQRPDALAAGEAAVGVVGQRQARVVVQLRDDGVDRRVHPIDPRQVRRHHLACRDVTTADQRRQLGPLMKQRLPWLTGMDIDGAPLRK